MASLSLGRLVGRRRRLARAVRRYARVESERHHRTGVIELTSIGARTALYEQIAERLEDMRQPVTDAGVESLEGLLAEPPPIRDYGPRALARNDRIRAILGDLEGDSG